MAKHNQFEPIALSTRAIHVLIRTLNLENGSDMAALAKQASLLHRNDLVQAENCGPATIREIERWLGSHSLRLQGCLTADEEVSIGEAIALLKRHGYRISKGKNPC